MCTKLSYVVDGMDIRMGCLGIRWDCPHLSRYQDSGSWSLFVRNDGTCGITSDAERRVAAIMLILLVYAGSVLVLHYLFVLNRWLSIILSCCACFYCLAGTTLYQRSKAGFWLRIIFRGRKQRRFPVLPGRDTSGIRQIRRVRAACREFHIAGRVILSDGVLLHYSGIRFGSSCMLAWWEVTTLCTLWIRAGRNEQALSVSSGRPLQMCADDMANYGTWAPP